MCTKITFQATFQDEEAWVSLSLGFMKKLADYVDGKVQILVVDGGSKDRTLEKIRLVADERFEIIINPFESMSKQLNLANSKSDGEWIYNFAADLTATDEIYKEINYMTSVKEVKAWSFPQIDLIVDTMHMTKIQWILNMRRNDSRFNWRGADDSMENLYYNDTLIQQHPIHFVFKKWQRRVPNGVFLIHFANLKTKEQKIAKYLKRSKMTNSMFYGWSEKNVVSHIMNAPKPKPSTIQSIEKTIKTKVNYYGQDWRF